MKKSMLLWLIDCRKDIDELKTKAALLEAR